MAICEQCGKVFSAKRATARYCSAKCRKLAFRDSARVSVPGVKSLSVPAYKLIQGAVYGRRAVQYDLSERWSSRPEPLASDDRPKSLNRGKYIRPDGSEYQFDARGRPFDCTIVDGKSLIYPTAAAFGQGQLARRAEVV